MKNLLAISTALFLISCSFVPVENNLPKPEPSESEPLGFEPLGSEPLGSEPLENKGQLSEVGQLVENNRFSEQLVAQNMIETLTQLLPIGRATIAIEDNEFNNDYWRLLVNEGYAVRVAKVSDNLLKDVLKIEKETNNGVQNYVLLFNEIVLMREYAIGTEKVYPISPMFVTSTSTGATSIELDDTIFEGENQDGDVSRVVMTKAKSSNVVAQSSTQTRIERIRAARNRPHKVKNPEAAAVSLSPNLSNRNVFDLGESNYQSLFDQYEDVYMSNIVFGNDSFSLEEDNKQQVAKLVKIIIPDTDVVSVVGCSNGRTGTGKENSVLAVARANRVKEEFMSAGVDGEKVLEEACYSDQYADHLGLPRRGVQVKIKRLKL